jgi:hypothetical protein
VPKSHTTTAGRLGFISEHDDIEAGATGLDLREAQSMSPTTKPRRMTLGDRLARGAAGVSQFFLAEQATAALTSGTYAGRQGAVTFLDATPSLPLNDEGTRAPSSAPGRARGPGDDVVLDSKPAPPLARLTPVDIPAVISEGDGDGSDDTPSVISPEVGETKDVARAAESV